MNDWSDLSFNVQISEGISNGSIPTDFDYGFNLASLRYAKESKNEKRIFSSFEEAKEWAKKNVGKSFTRYGETQFIEK